MKMTIAAIFCAMGLFLGYSPLASADSVPAGFVGSYALSHDRYGICEPTLEVYTLDSSGGYTSLTMGPYFFDRVGGGEWINDDSVEKQVNETKVVSSNQIVHTSKIHVKSNGENYRLMTKATLKGTLLTIRATYRGGIINTVTECVYAKIAE